MPLTPAQKKAKDEADLQAARKRQKDAMDAIKERSEAAKKKAEEDKKAQHATKPESDKKPAPKKEPVKKVVPKSPAAKKEEIRKAEIRKANVYDKKTRNAIEKEEFDKKSRENQDAALKSIAEAKERYEAEEARKAADIAHSDQFVADLEKQQTSNNQQTPIVQNQQQAQGNNPAVQKQNSAQQDPNIPVTYTDPGQTQPGFTASGNAIKPATQKVPIPKAIKDRFLEAFPEVGWGPGIANAFKESSNSNPLSKLFGEEQAQNIYDLSQWLESGLNDAGYGSNYDSGNIDNPNANEPFYRYRIPNFTDEQQQLQNTALSQAMSELMSPQRDPGITGIENQATQDFYNKTVPTLAERFTALGGGNRLGSSGFQGALGSAASQLQTQLAALRDQHGLQQQQFNQNRLGQLFNVGMQPAFNTGIEPKGPSTLQSGMNMLGKVLPKGLALLATLYGGPAAGAATSTATSAVGSNLPKVQ